MINLTDRQDSAQDDAGDETTERSLTRKRQPSPIGYLSSGVRIRHDGALQFIVDRRRLVAGKTWTPQSFIRTRVGMELLLRAHDKAQRTDYSSLLNWVPEYFERDQANVLLGMLPKAKSAPLHKYPVGQQTFVRSLRPSKFTPNPLARGHMSRQAKLVMAKPL